jgi:CheY-like chemotaxis protein
VLVVDDLPDMIQSMAILLPLWGHDVRTARNGLEALDVAADYRPNVVLLDVSMPGLNGYQVARQLRSIPTLCRTFLVSVTGHGGEAAIKRSQEAGCDYHLLKPVDPNELERLLASRKKAQNEARTEEDSEDTSTGLLPPADAGAATDLDAAAVAENRLRRHHYMALRHVSCAYRDGVLTLHGCLPTYYLKQIAQAVVAGIEGVERIQNEIVIVGHSPAPPDWTRGD